MKRVWLVRHAKSDWGNPTLSDFDRPLNKRGILSADFMGIQLSTLKVQPDKIISSDAKRALSTARILITKINCEDRLETDHSIYASHYSNMHNILDHLPEELNSVMLVGHNPGMSDLCNYLTGEHIHMVTCAIAEVELEVDSWKEITKGCGRLVDFNFPKKHSGFLEILKQKKS